MRTIVSGFDGPEVAYMPRRVSETVGTVSASVDIGFAGNFDARLHLSIEDARSLAEQLPAVLAQHEAAEAAESAAVVDSEAA
ncbi:hypothetical protein [Nocardia sp. NPDC024068]|uniref:hypothetical protein n=1 Tax=Nocardia sp. NPDC024068 TaxID=3157197 RepID=UPI0033C55827